MKIEKDKSVEKGMSYLYQSGIDFLYFSKPTKVCGVMVQGDYIEKEDVKEAIIKAVKHTRKGELKKFEEVIDDYDFCCGDKSCLGNTNIRKDLKQKLKEK